ncbi:pro-resilin-like [Ctenocephalides felis]|uniref:pro-resilin-like n=1 Tax=Ctenocephalides felis TaxID=7515 RepID=UPI000E6E3641|nr:pro-resilin-like [Ctenocephalides felis]
MQVMNNPFVTGVGLSGNYDSRTLSLGDSFSGSGKGYQLGSLGNGQSPQFDFTGKNLEQVPSGHLGTQKLHTMVSFSSLEPHTPSTSYGQPQESYGAPTESDSNSFNVGHQSVQQTYGTPDFVGSQGAISSVMIQSGDKQGPVMFYGGTPTPNSLSGTFITMANNPSNSYGVPMYAQSSGSQSGHQPSFSVGGHTNQLFASYTTGGGQSNINQNRLMGHLRFLILHTKEESSASYLPPSSSYGAPTASASTSYEAPSVSYGAPNTKIPFKPSPFIGATSPLSYKESNRDLNAYSTQISHNYEAAGGSSYDAPVYNTISYSMPSSLDTQYTQTH